MSTTTDLTTLKINYLTQAQYDAAVSGGTINENEIYMTPAKGVPFYNVVDYGIEPNNGDVYDALHDLLADVVYDTGGIVYFPAGKYTLSYTIFIPENTTFIGDGESTEIYFDETDAAFGVGLSNAGSNVTIKNMTVSQSDTGTFGTGAQNGCIGFSDLAKSQAKVGKKVHTFNRADAYNLTAENLYFSGKYPIQTENSTTGKITNVVYRNLYCPTGCVSVSGNTATIENTLIENVTCDLLRVTVTQAQGKLKGVTINNAVCQNFYLYNKYETESKVVINNLRQTTDTRHNTFINSGADAVYVNGSAQFNGCVFNALSAETYGVHVYDGIREWNDCTFNMYKRIFTRGSALSDTDGYDHLNNCILNAQTTESSAGAHGAVIGYGRNNIINASHFNNYIWGNIYKTVALTGTSQISSSTHPSRVIIDGDKLRLSLFVSISNTNSVSPLPSGVTGLPLFGDAIPIVVWDYNNRASTQTTTFGKIDNGTLKVTEVGQNNLTTYNRALVEYALELTALPTPTQIFNLIG